MADKRLELIRKSIDTKGTRLADDAKNLLCKVLENPSKYDGFMSKIFTRPNSGRDFRDTWNSLTEWQYRIITSPKFVIYRRQRHSCDGFVQDKYWDWENAGKIEDLKGIVKALKEMFDQKTE